jgi:hypothetical protein
MAIDAVTVWTSVLASLSVSSAVTWLGRSIIAHHLSRDLERHKAETGGKVRQEVELALADRTAPRTLPASRASTGASLPSPKQSAGLMVRPPDGLPAPDAWTIRHLMQDGEPA